MSEVVNFITSINSQAAAWLSKYLIDIIMLVLICLVSIYGASLNKAVSRLIGQRNFFVKTSVFILVTGIGIGSFILFIRPYALSLVKQIPSTYLPLSACLIFIILGVLAARKNQI